MAELMSGEEISRILASTGNVVKCVLLRAAPDATNDDGKKPAAAKKQHDGDSKTPNEQTQEKTILKDLIDEIEVDTTPKKSQAQEILGGPITFLGQYEDEDLVLICRRPETLEKDTPMNSHKLQPPFEHTKVQGDILIMRVKPHQDKPEQQADGCDETSVAASDDDFFLDFTKHDYIHFALRDDVEPPEFQEVQSGDDDEEIEEEQEEEEEYLGEDDDDEDDEEAQVAMMNLIMAQVLRRFHDENGRGPNTQELLELRSALAQKLGVEVPGIQDDAEEEEKREDKPSGKRVAENGGDEGGTKRVKFSQEAIEGESIEAEPDQKQEEPDSWGKYVCRRLLQWYTRSSTGLKLILQVFVW